MRKLSCLIMLLMLAIGISNIDAQNKMNVDNLRFSYHERAMPKKNFMPQFFNYTAQFSLPKSVKFFIDKDELFDNLFIADQRRTENLKYADMLVNVSMGPIEIPDFKIEHRAKEEKNRDGEVIRQHVYWLVVSYTFEAQAENVRLSNNVVVERYGIVNRKTKRTFVSAEYRSRREADMYWINNQEILREEFTRKEALIAIAKLSAMMTDQYACLVNKKSSLIKTINEKEHPENDDLRAMSNSLAEKLKLLNGTDKLLEEDVLDELSYFMQIPQRYPDAKLEVDVRLRYVAYYNICRIYLFLDQPEKVSKWANLLTKNNYDKKDGKRLTNDAQLLQKQLLGIGTRQFDPRIFFEKE